MGSVEGFKSCVCEGVSSEENAVQGGRDQCSSSCMSREVGL